jgi:hypothetical protein
MRWSELARVARSYAEVAVRSLTTWLMMSPFIIPTLGLTAFAVSRRGHFDEPGWERREARFAVARWWALAPWVPLVAVSPLVASWFGASTAAVVAWYGLPALAFTISFAPYFYFALTHRRGPDGVRRAYRLRLHAWSLWSTCVVSAVAITVYFGEAAVLLKASGMIFMVIFPVTWANLIFVGALLHPRSFAHVEGPNNVNDGADVLAAQQTASLAPDQLLPVGPRWAANFDRLLYSDLYAFLLTLAEWMLMRAGATAGSSRLELLPSVAALGLFGVHITAVIQRFRRGPPRPKLSLFVRFMNVVACLCMLKVIAGLVFYAFTR